MSEENEVHSEKLNEASSPVDELNGSPLLSQVLGQALPQMKMFHVKLSREGIERGLIGPRELNRLWERHILNSAALAPFLSRYAKKHHIQHLRVADVGSGAGFPGIVLAALLPDDYFTLIEPMERRVDWLQEVIKELGLHNARVQRDRAENLKGQEQFDVVTCRAVARMTKLTPWVMPLVRRGGQLTALKGAAAQTEILKAQQIIRHEHGFHPRVELAEVAPGLEPTHVVLIDKR